MAFIGHRCRDCGCADWISCSGKNTSGTVVRGARIGGSPPLPDRVKTGGCRRHPGCGRQCNPDPNTTVVFPQWTGAGQPITEIRAPGTDVTGGNGVYACSCDACRTRYAQETGQEAP